MPKKPQDRIGDPNERADDQDLELSLRPRRFDDFVGQRVAKEQLEIFVEAAKQRGDTLDHVLIAGPPGLGKTTLAGIISQELGVGMHTTSGPALERKVDVAGLLTNLQEGDVLFVDEIHRLNAAVEEVLYPAMEDYEIDIMIGEGPAARSIRMQVAPFTLIGATTRTGLLTTPLRDRFGVWQRLEYYEVEELAAIVRRSAGILGVEIDQDSALEIAGRSRGTPRVANRLLRRVRDFAQVRHEGVIDHDDLPRGARALPGRRRGPRQARPRHPQDHRREVRRRPGGPRHARRRARRRGRHGDGRLRAVPDHAGLPQAHAARPRAHAQRLPALRAQAAGRPGTRSSTSSDRPAGCAGGLALYSPDDRPAPSHLLRPVLDRRRAGLAGARGRAAWAGSRTRTSSRPRSWSAAARACGATAGRPASSSSSTSGGEEAPGWAAWRETLATAAPDERCAACLGLRLDAAGAAARELGFARFSTTLTVSPYQRHDLIVAAGEAAADAHGVDFVYLDVRDRFRDSYAESRRLELYRQPYCGCAASKWEAWHERRARRRTA